MTASSVIVFGRCARFRCSPFRRCSAGPRWTLASSAPPVIGAVVFVLMFALGAACLLFDRPLMLIGRAAQWVRNRVMRAGSRAGTCPSAC